MAAAETARLIASLELQDRNFTRGIRQVERGVDRVDKKLSAVGGFVNRNLARALDTAASKLVGVVGTGLEELATLEDASTSVAGAIQQVGKGWTLTADDIATAANRIESETDAAFDDKAIVAATETLIRYGKVTETNIEPAMQVMTDLAARTGDVESASTLLAKALADPAKAAGKLARQGIVLTKQQQKQIKAMVEAGDTAGAQAFLLEELTKTTKGAAAASAGPYRDALNKLGDAGEDLRRGFVTGLAPAILEVSDLLTSELAKPSTINTLKDFGKEIGSGLKSLIGIVKALPWETIGTSLKIAGTGAKAILDAFLGLPPWIQTAVLTGWGLNKLTGGKLFDVGKIAFDFLKGRGSTPANPLFTREVGLGGGGGPLGGGGKGGGRFGRFGGAVALGAGAVAVIGFERAITIWEETNQRSTEQANTAQDSLNAMLAQNPKLSDMLTAQRATRDGIKDIKSNPLLTIVQGEALDRLNSMDAQLTKAIEERARPIINERAPKNAALNQASIESREGGGKTTKAELEKIRAGVQAGATATKNAQSVASRENSAQKTELGNIKNSIAAQTQTQQAAAVAAAATQALQGSMQAARDALQRISTATAGTNTAAAARSAGTTAAAATNSSASRIVAAIWAARPQVKVTNVVEKYTTIVRTGNTSGSRNSGPLP